VTTILGLVGSARRWGNSDLLVRRVLQGAQAEGASVQLLRLTGLDLQACTGCLRCVIGGKPCPLDDDTAWLIETIQAADGLALAAPTYFLGPAAVVKLALDRLMMVTGQVDGELPPPRPAVTMVTAGLRDWRGITLPYLNALVAAFGYRPIESLTAVAPGPGEVLLDEALMDRALAAGHRLGRGELEPAPAPSNVCPTCHNDAFRIEAGHAICPICGQEGRLEEGPEGVVVRFDPLSGASQRWTPEGLRKHMTEWVMATGPRFMAHRAEIKVRRRPYRQMEVEWLQPGRPEDSSPRDGHRP